MDAKFMNSEKRKISDPYRIVFNLTGKMNLKPSGKDIALSNFDLLFTWKNMRKSCNI